MKRAIITGATGAIGIALADRLLQENYEVVAIVNPESKRICSLPQSDKLHIIKCSLNKLESLGGQEVGYCDVFYHLAWMGAAGAARDDLYLQNGNVRYTLDAVNLAGKCGCEVFIGAGSQAEYGRVEGKLNGDTPANPETGYGAAKLCAGQMSRILCEQKGIKHIWTRILSVYGPFDGEKTMIMSTIDALLRGDRAPLTMGEQQWDYLYAKDAGKALYLLGEKGISGKTYCIGSGETKQLREYVRALGNKVSGNAELGFGDIPYSEKQVMYLCADIGDLKRDTGFFPDYGFEEGIGETIRWYKGEKGT